MFKQNYCVPSHETWIGGPNMAQLSQRVNDEKIGEIIILLVIAGSR